MNIPMKKRKIALMALLLISIAALIFVYFWLEGDEPYNNIIDDNPPLSGLTLPDVENIYVSYEGDSFMLVMQEGRWVVYGAEGIMLENLMAGSLVTNIINLRAETIDIPELNLAELGLDETRRTIIVNATNTEGVPEGDFIIHLGGMTVTGEYFYLMIEGDSEIYLVSANVGNFLNVSLTDLRSRRLPVIHTPGVQYVFISERDRPVIELRMNDEATNLDIWRDTLGFNMLIFERPFRTPRGAYISRIEEEILIPITYMRIKDFIDDAPADYSIFGLDNPFMRIMVSCETEDGLRIVDLGLEFGNFTEDGDVYFRLTNSPNVYTMSREFLNPLIGLDAFELADKFVFISDSQITDRVEITAGGRLATIGIYRVEDGQDTYTFNGSAISTERFRELYQHISGISADYLLADDVVRGELAASITYFVGDRFYTVRYFEYTEGFLAAEVFGVLEFAVHRSSVDRMIRAVIE